MPSAQGATRPEPPSADAPRVPAPAPSAQASWPQPAPTPTPGYVASPAAAYPTPAAAAPFASAPAAFPVGYPAQTAPVAPAPAAAYAPQLAPAAQAGWPQQQPQAPAAAASWPQAQPPAAWAPEAAAWPPAPAGSQAAPSPRIPAPGDQPRFSDPFVAPQTSAESTAGYTAMMRPFTARRRWWILALVMLVILAAATTTATILLIPREDPPQVEILTTPLGASVALDGKPVPGRTPLTLREALVAGRAYRVEVSMPGFETWVSTFQAQPGRMQQLVIMVPLRATLHVDSDPPGSTIYVAGAFRGTAPLDLPDLPIGSVLEIVAQHPDRLDGHARITIAEGDLRPRVVITLAPR